MDRDALSRADEVAAGALGRHRLPEAVRLAPESSDRNADIRALSEALERDPEMADLAFRLASVLSLSAEPHGSVGDLATDLGTPAIELLALAVGTCGTYIAPGGLDAVTSRIWLHNAATCVLASMLGERYPCDAPAAAVLGAILHDIGRVALHEHDPDGYTRALLFHAETACSELDAERAAFGADHQLVGGQIAVGWGLPDEAAWLLTRHHEPPFRGPVPRLGGGPATPRPLTAAYLIHLADYVATLAGLEPVRALPPVDTDLEAWPVLGINLADAVGMARDLQPRLGELLRVLGMPAVDLAEQSSLSRYWPGLDWGRSVDELRLRVDQRMRDLALFRNRIAAIPFGRNLEQTLEFLTSETLEPLGFGRMIVYVVASGAGLLMPWHIVGDDAIVPSALPAIPLGSAVDQLAAVGRGEAARLLDRAENGRPQSALLDALGARRLAAAPITGAGRTFGVLLADTPDDGCGATVADARVLGAIAVQLGGFLEYAEAAAAHTVAEEDSVDIEMCDPETGIYNREALNERLERETTRSQRTAIPFSVVLFSVESFDRIADLEAEARLDALSRLVEAVYDSVRASDDLYRASDSEFVLLLPETPLSNAPTPAETIFQAMSRARLDDIAPGLGQLDVTWSVVGYPDDGDTYDAILSAVESKLRVPTGRADG